MHVIRLLMNMLFKVDYIQFQYGFGVITKQVIVEPNGVKYVKIGHDVLYLINNQLIEPSRALLVLT